MYIRKVLEKTLESSLESKEIQPKGNQSWIFIGRIDAEAEAPILWPPDVKSWFTGKTLMLGKIEGRRRRGWQRMRWLGSTTNSIDMSLSKLQRMVKDKEAWRAAVHGVTKVRHDWAIEQQQQWFPIQCSLFYTKLSRELAANDIITLFLMFCICALSPQVNYSCFKG